MNIFLPILKIVWSNVQKADHKRINSQIKPGGVKEILDVKYKCSSNERGHLLDVYYPDDVKNDKKLPVIIDVHGGGWLYGYKEINKYYCLELAKRGFCVFSLNYRLAMDKNIMLIDQLHDLFDAYKWIGENISDYPADINNVFLTGDSAGGHFVCLSAALNIDSSLRDEYQLPSNALTFKCIGATSAVIDLVSPNIMLNANLTSLLGLPHSTSPYYKLMKFSNIATSFLPPFFIVTSSGDFVQSQSIKLHKMLDNLNVENEFHNWSEKINGKKLPHVFSVIDPFTAPAITTIDRMTAFFLNHAD